MPRVRAPFRRVKEVQLREGVLVDLLECDHEVPHEGPGIRPGPVGSFGWGHQCPVCPKEMDVVVIRDEMPPVAKLSQGGSGLSAFLDRERKGVPRKGVVLDSKGRPKETRSSSSRLLRTARRPALPLWKREEE